MPRPDHGDRAGQAVAVLGLTGDEPAVELDARLLEAGPAALRAALADRLGTPTLVVVHHLDAVDDDCLAALRHLPMLVAGREPAADTALAAIDLVLDGDADEAQARRGFARAPVAATTAAMLLREPSGTWWDGLVRESAAYSMLQGGGEFQRWLAARGAPRPPSDANPRLRVKHHDSGVTEITLTRAERHNALDVRMRDELHAAFEVATGPVVLLGDGASFCSGGDLDEFGTFPDPAAAHLIRLARSLAALSAHARPRMVFGLHGASLGAGIELAAFSDHVVAADDLRAGLPELGLGLIPGAGGTVSLPARIGRHRTLELLILDGTIAAPAALEWGLVDEVVPRAQLRPRCLEIAGSLS